MEIGIQMHTKIPKSYILITLSYAFHSAFDQCSIYNIREWMFGHKKPFKLNCICPEKSLTFKTKNQLQKQCHLLANEYFPYVEINQAAFPISISASRGPHITIQCTS